VNKKHELGKLFGIAHFLEMSPLSDWENNKKEYCTFNGVEVREKINLKLYLLAKESLGLRQNQ
jgi:hypothetical protein